MRDKLTLEVIFIPQDDDLEAWQFSRLRAWAQLIAACVRRNVETGRYAVTDDGRVICAKIEPNGGDGIDPL
jgi:hypothetical protein